MKNIVITNFYGYENIGDAAIFESAIKIINKAIPKNIIDVHSATIFNDKNFNTYLHPYGVAIKTSDKPITNLKKITRFTKVASISLYYGILGKISPNTLPKSGDYSYIRSLKDADLVLGIGGGYLRTKSKYKDYFGLLLTLLPLSLAHLYKKEILYLPMSYGNFAATLHDDLVFNVIKNDTIVFRDQISLDEFNKHTNKKSNIHLIPDLALFDGHESNKKIVKKDYIVLTARLWMEKTKQTNYEKDLARFVDYVWEKYHLKTVFIPMVWNEKEEDDNKVAKRIETSLKNKNIFKIVKVKTPSEVKEVLSYANFAICTRMHSAILATIVRTPFITIAYEYKTLGLLKHLGLEEWNMDIHNFTYNKLKIKFDKLFKEKEKFVDKLEKAHMKIAEKENKLIEIITAFKLQNEK